MEFTGGSNVSEKDLLARRRVGGRLICSGDDWLSVPRERRALENLYRPHFPRSRESQCTTYPQKPTPPTPVEMATGSCQERCGRMSLDTHEE
ncbi:hypothetical protein GW17_00003378 [Ensete ventricosum]|nr:hypothetical protein GW17_00003378 [Ensete ventricosum]